MSCSLGVGRAGENGSKSGIHEVLRRSKSIAVLDKKTFTDGDAEAQSHPEAGTTGLLTSRLQRSPVAVGLTTQPQGADTVQGPKNAKKRQLRVIQILLSWPSFR